jgi:threonine/homoserine/homoserine lactone efflux protein
MVTTFATGVAVGLAVAAPVGPITILCVRRTLNDGRRVGFAAGLGVALADSLYAAIAAFGLTAASAILVAQERWLAALSGAVLVVLGLRLLAARRPTGEAPPQPFGLAGAFATTFALTLANPMTILAFIAVFVGLGYGTEGEGFSGAALFVTGVFAGSCAWWALIVSGVGMVRGNLGEAALRKVDFGAGLVLIALGTLAAARALD